MHSLQTLIKFYLNNKANPILSPCGRMPCSGLDRLTLTLPEHEKARGPLRSQSAKRRRNCLKVSFAIVFGTNGCISRPISLQLRCQSKSLHGVGKKLLQLSTNLKMLQLVKESQKFGKKTERRLRIQMSFTGKGCGLGQHSIHVADPAEIICLSSQLIQIIIKSCLQNKR